MSTHIYVLEVLDGASDVLCTCLLLMFSLALELEPIPYVGQVILIYVPV